MSSRARIAGIVGLLFLFTGCNGSGSSSVGPTEAACVGVGCGRDDAPVAPLACAATGSGGCPQGYRCVADPARNCGPSQDCPGTCVLGEDLLRCGGLTGAACPDGFLCSDDPSDPCEGGPAVDCPGICRPAADRDCDNDADCPQPDVACEACADGTLGCAKTRCDAGRCTVDVKPCVDPPACGGIAGSTCPPGTACVDDPADDCDPRNGGADCGGICVPDDGPRRCGGPDVCPPGYECVGIDGEGCEPNDSGTDCGGVCRPRADGECTSDADCPTLRAPCFTCADGNEICPRSMCDGGRCNVIVPPCVAPLGCSQDADCLPGEVCAGAVTENCDPATGAACSGVCMPDPGSDPRRCGFAGETCPTGYECVDDRRDECNPEHGGADCPGVCAPIAPPPCRSDDECPRILAPCHLCPDGTYACPHSECRDGTCIALFDACKPGFCSGFPGFPCPPGATCIDDPNDDCDPQAGGADCAGICVREEEPRRCGGIAGETCPPGYECADDRRDACNPDAGGADCPGVCRPAPSGTCRSDADCAVIAACLVCADGTTACPSAGCVNGICSAEFPGCGEG
jgi:hypothetical protein